MAHRGLAESGAVFALSPRFGSGTVTLAWATEISTGKVVEFGASADTFIIVRSYKKCDRDARI
jgi:hypothetical protein